MKKPISEACERNKGPILEVLKQYIQPAHRRLLEIGAGTGQHAVYFAPRFPQLQWMVTDVPANHNIIAMWLREAGVDNIEGPLRFKVGTDEFPTQPMDRRCIYREYFSHHAVEKCKDAYQNVRTSLAQGLIGDDLRTVQLQWNVYIDKQCGVRCMA